MTSVYERLAAWLGGTEHRRAIVEHKEGVWFVTLRTHGVVAPNTLEVVGVARTFSRAAVRALAELREKQG